MFACDKVTAEMHISLAEAPPNRKHMHLFYHGLMNLFCTPEGLSTLEVKSITDYISPVNLEVGRMMSIRSIDTVNTKYLSCNGIV